MKAKEKTGVKIQLLEFLLDLKLRTALLGFRPLSFILNPSSFVRRPGQTTVEYLLMLAVVAGMASIMGVLFHRRILGGIFTLVGMIIGAGTPTTGP
ncbi:MAG: hypothetical protein HY550_09095 [Elusimicrobia bacterium]|nr:hypothetical protein [Elusimicrobiota bacterium]